MSRAWTAHSNAVASLSRGLPGLGARHGVTLQRGDKGGSGGCAVQGFRFGGRGSEVGNEGSGQGADRKVAGAPCESAAGADLRGSGSGCGEGLVRTGVAVW